MGRNHIDARLGHQCHYGVLAPFGVPHSGGTPDPWGMGYGIPSPWDTPSPNGIGKQGLRPQKTEPYLQRGFIPRARARGHARTLRARALYGMAGACNMCRGSGYPLIMVGAPLGPWALGPRGLSSLEIR